MSIQFRQITEADVGTLRLLAQACPPLGLHTAFTYWVIAHFYKDYSFLALDSEGQPIGFITCITKRDEPDLIYVWQIGVLPESRRNKIARRLLDHLCKKINGGSGIRRIQVTIDPDNEPSNRLFRSLANDRRFGYNIIGDACLTDPIDQVSEAEKLIEITMS